LGKRGPASQRGGKCGDYLNQAATFYSNVS
jgi:hypothetical protein